MRYANRKKNVNTKKMMRNDTQDPCPNPMCSKKRDRHTIKQAKECLQIAMADA